MSDAARGDAVWLELLLDAISQHRKIPHKTFAPARTELFPVVNFMDELLSEKFQQAILSGSRAPSWLLQRVIMTKLMVPFPEKLAPTIVHMVGLRILPSLIATLVAFSMKRLRNNRIFCNRHSCAGQRRIVKKFSILAATTSFFLIRCCFQTCSSLFLNLRQKNV